MLCLDVRSVNALVVRLGNLSPQARQRARSAPPTPECAVWWFAALIAVDKPLDQDVAAAIRSLLKWCCAARAGLVRPESDVLPTLNVLIAIAGAYFAQADADSCDR